MNNKPQDVSDCQPIDGDISDFDTQEDTARDVVDKAQRPRPPEGWRIRLSSGHLGWLIVVALQFLVVIVIGKIQNNMILWHYAFTILSVPIGWGVHFFLFGRFRHNYEREEKNRDGINIGYERVSQNPTWGSYLGSLVTRSDNNVPIGFEFECMFRVEYFSWMLLALSCAAVFGSSIEDFAATVTIGTPTLNWLDFFLTILEKSSPRAFNSQVWRTRSF